MKMVFQINIAITCSTVAILIFLIKIYTREHSSDTWFQSQWETKTAGCVWKRISEEWLTTLYHNSSCELPNTC